MIFKVLGKETNLLVEEFNFYINDSMEITLHSFFILERPTIKHKWRIRSKYDRILKRDNTIDVSEIPITTDIHEKARIKIHNLIKFKS